MNRIAHACAAFFAVLIGASGSLALGGTAVAAASCEEEVLLDWSDNGRIDRVYPLHCYDEAIEAMPPDLRDYTDAAEVIRRALTTALRAESGKSDQGTGLAAGARTTTSGPSSMPVLLLVLGGFTLAVLAAGGLGYVSRRRRAHDGGDDTVD